MRTPTFLLSAFLSLAALVFAAPVPVGIIRAWTSAVKATLALICSSFSTREVAPLRAGLVRRFRPDPVGHHQQEGPPETARVVFTVHVPPHSTNIQHGAGVTLDLHVLPGSTADRVITDYRVTTTGPFYNWIAYTHRPTGLVINAQGHLDGVDYYLRSS